MVLKSEKVNHGVRLIHLSDIHAEHFGSMASKIITITNKYNPDIILTTGDMFIMPYKYNRSGFDAVITVFENIDIKKTIILINGHHDFNKAHHIVEALPEKTRLLKDQWYMYDELGISAFGADLESGINDFNTVSDDNFKIYLAHKPDRVKNITQKEFDLALFGHTHAGQVYIPLVTEIITGKYRHGLYNYHGIPIYVNAGIGLEGYLAPRIRWFTFPEIVIIDIEPVEDN